MSTPLGGQDLSALAAEQAALRRVAALVARGAAPEEVFAAVLEEVGRLLSVEYVQMGRYEPDDTLAVVASWGNAGPAVSRTMLGGKNLGTIVFETGRSARIDSYADASWPIGVAARETGVRSAVGTPITIEGRLWGVMVAGSRGEQALPADAEARLASFAELLATTIANADSRAGVTRLVADQAALRRVATLVARAVPPEDVFAAVVEEVGRLLPVDFADLGRCEPDGTITFLAAWGKTRPVFPVGARVRLGGKNATTLVAQTGGPARIESYADASGPIGAPTHETGVRSAIGTPITVEGHLWGVMAAGWSLEEPMPADTEPRVAQFTDLVATAIANAESRAGLARLVEEQAALRRVATMVARGAAPEKVFAAITEEVGRLLPVDFADMSRFEPDGAVTFVAAWGTTAAVFPVGSRWIPEGKNLCSLVARTGRPARIESYADAAGPIDVAVRGTGVRSAVGTPIIVEGRVWGVMAAGTRREEPMPADTEPRLTQFTELLATAVANAESRAGLARLAEEQAALRRVATLVARGTRPDELFAAVTNEVGRLLSVDMANLCRYESDGTLTFVASAGERFPVGSRWPLGGQKNLATLVLETGRPARIDNYADAAGPLADDIRERGVRSAVGTPIIVEGRLWGLMAAASSQEPPLPADTEARLASFTELVATAIANAESRSALAASRARIVAAADESRRRIERDLHDGTQQQLVSLMLELRSAQTQPAAGALQAQLAHIERGVAGALDELREISRGIHPAILARGGLERALRALARRSAVPVELHLDAQRPLPEPVEVAAYYAVSEALTNAARHAHASVVNVELDAHDSVMQLAIHDDGVGGADPKRGSGLVGLSDRIEALGGTFQVTSPAGHSTTLLIEVPLEGQSSAGSPEP
jgi:GAF domain-containing protein